MSGFFGCVSKRDCVADVFYGTDYHSHLGTKRGGMAFYDGKDFVRTIHSLENAYFRNKFEDDLPRFEGSRQGIGIISDMESQPITLTSHLGRFSLVAIGRIDNLEELTRELLGRRLNFAELSASRINPTELVATLVSLGDSFREGIELVQSKVKGSCSMLILTPEGILAARDGVGRLPILVGKGDEGCCVSFESFAYHKLGYADHYELGPGEIVRVTPEGVEQLAAPGEKMKICAFLWTYYGYPNSNYEGKNVEVMRYRNGQIMARDEMERGTLPEVDYVAGVPDSGLPHAIGYSNQSQKPFARPFVKYTPTWPRSFMPSNQNVRNQVAKMKQIPVPELIQDKKLLFVDDSIVRGTQLRETVEFLYESGAKEVHMRSACPPIMYGCKYLNFSASNSDMELLARRVVQELEGDEGQQHLEEYADSRTERGQCLLKSICQKMGFDSLGYQSLDGLLEAIGLDRDRVCTYCWTGKE